MARTLYSTRFLRNASSTATAVYTVPAGHRAVLRSLVATVGPKLGNSYVLEVASSSVYLWLPPADYTSVTADFRIVAYAGEVLRLISGGATAGCIVSGYLFDDTVIGGRAELAREGEALGPAIGVTAGELAQLP